MFTIRQQKIDQSLLKRFQPKPKPKPKRRGRKASAVARKSNRIKCTTFSKTPLGDFLLKHCPLEYELIAKAKREGLAVNADLAETISCHSNSPAFHSVEFRKALADYRRYKCRTPNKVQFDLDSEIAAIKRKLKIGDQ